MGRAIRANGPCSGRSDERTTKICRVRTKRKKRKKELEELHRNVLVAKRISRLRVPQENRRKTTFAKVLINFADQRRDSEDENQVIGDAGKQVKRTKPKTICKRLLPEPMIGMYENGAKGREIRRVNGGLPNDTNVARLRGNVLKLLKGHETNPKSSRDREENETTERSKMAAAAHPSDGSDSGNEYGYRLVKDNPVHGKSNGVKRLNREKERTIIGLNETTTRAKDQPNELPYQRDEDKCKRRLFDSDDKDKSAENSFGNIDRPMITDDVPLRFTPKHREADVAADELNTPKNCIDKQTTKKNDKNVENKGKLCTPANKELKRINFWGWSPFACYERLCAIMCIENFENERRRRYRVPERIVNIQRILTGVYIRSARNSRLNPQKNSTQSDYRDSSGRWLNKNRSFLTINKADKLANGHCIKDSQKGMDSTPEETSSSITMIGSWHPPKRSYSVENEITTMNKNRIDDNRTMRNDKESNEMNDESSLNNDKNDDECIKKSKDIVRSTINSVSEFLKHFQQPKASNNRANEKNFALQLAPKVVRDRNEDKKENSNDYPVTPRCDWTVDYNFNSVIRRNAKKHVPTILRRSNGVPASTVHTKTSLDTEQRIFSAAARRDIDVKRVERHAPAKDVTGNVFPFSPLMPSPTSEFRSDNHTFYSPSPPLSSIIEKSNNHYRISSRATNNEKSIQQLVRGNSRATKLNFPNYKYERKKTEENADNLSDRSIEKTRRAFVNAMNVKNDTKAIGNRSIFPNQKIEKPAIERCRVDDGTARHQQLCHRVVDEKKVTFFNDSRRYSSEIFEEKDNRKNAGRHEPCIVQQARHAPAHRENLVDVSHNHHEAHNRNFDVARSSDMSFFQFSRPADVANRRSCFAVNDATTSINASTGKFVSLREPSETDRRLLHSRNLNESQRIVKDNFANEQISRFSSFDLSHIGQWNTTDHRKEMYNERDSRILNRSNNSRSFRSVENTQHISENSWLRERECRAESSPLSIPPSAANLVQHRDIMKKPVVLFRPINESRDKPVQLRMIDSRDRNVETNATMSEAIRNLRVMAFENNVGEQSSIVGTSNNLRYQQPRQRFSPSRCIPQQSQDNENFGSCTQPAKFLAYNERNDDKPERIPIYVKADVLAAANSDNERGHAGILKIIDADKRTAETSARTIYMTSNENKRYDNNSFARLAYSEHPSDFYNHDAPVIVHSRDIAAPGTVEQSSSRRVALVLPAQLSSASCFNKNGISTLPSHETVCNDPRRVVYGIIPDQRAPTRTQWRYELEPSIVNRERGIDERLSKTRNETNANIVGDNRDISSRPKRFQLPDGRIGTLIVENTNFNNVGNATSIVNDRVHDTNAAETRQHYEMSNEAIVYSQSGYR